MEKYLQRYKKVAYAEYFDYLLMYFHFSVTTSKNSHTRKSSLQMKASESNAGERASSCKKPQYFTNH